MFRRSPYFASKQHVVVLGTGWAGASLVKGLSPALYDMTVLSQRNHMVFTPLLASTTCGTLEFRSVCEPIYRIQPALAQGKNSFLQTLVYDVDFDRKAVQCVAVGVIGASSKPSVEVFEQHYDKLVLAHGARPNTFNVPGVEDGNSCYFLREITESRGIRRRIIQNIMQATLPTTSPAERRRLLSIVAVGAGPTGVEAVGELADFLRADVPKIAPNIKEHFSITLVEAGEVLGSFDQNLRNYAVKSLTKRGIGLKKGVVAEVTDRAVVLTSGEVLEAGVVIWSTGVGPSTLSKALRCDKHHGRLAVDDHLRLMKNGKPIEDAFAIGDCAACINGPLPTLAAVASRQGSHLAAALNHVAKQGHIKPITDYKPFKYSHLLSMASLGGGMAVAEFKSPRSFDMSGFLAYLLWKSAYFTLLGSFRSRLYVAVNWFGSYIFGRDVTYIGETSETKIWKKLAREGASREITRTKLLEKAMERRNREVAAAAGATVSAASDSATTAAAESAAAKTTTTSSIAASTSAAASASASAATASAASAASSAVPPPAVAPEKKAEEKKSE